MGHPAEAERPVLELSFVFFGELRSSGDVGGFADHFVGFADLVREGVVEAGLDEADGEVGDVDADPATGNYFFGFFSMNSFKCFAQVSAVPLSPPLSAE